MEREQHAQNAQSRSWLSHSSDDNLLDGWEGRQFNRIPQVTPSRRQTPATSWCESLRAKGCLWTRHIGRSWMGAAVFLKPFQQVVHLRQKKTRARARMSPDTLCDHLLLSRCCAFQVHGHPHNCGCRITCAIHSLSTSCARLLN